MILDDVRVLWLRDRALAALGLTDPAPFEELLDRGDGEEGRAILRFFDRGTEEGDDEGEAGATLLLLRAEWCRQDGEEAAGTGDTEEFAEEQQEEGPDECFPEQLTETASSVALEGSMTQKSKASPLQPTDNESVSGHVSALSSQSELGKLEQRFTTDDMEHTPQLQEQKVDKVCFYVALDEIPKEFVSNFTVYFLRDAKERVAEPSDLSEANEVLPKVIKFGVLTDDSLLMLKNAISQAFSPAVSFSQLQIEETSENTDSEKGNLPKTEKKEQLVENGNIKLEMPTVNLDREVTALATDPEVVEALESYAMTLQKLISIALEEQMKKVPEGNGPLAEIDLWRERNENLSALTEQTKLPEVQKVLEILQEAESQHTGDLQIVLSHLRKHHVEALDNVKFLSTLERHLKTLTYGTGFNVVLDTIPPLMNTLRMVWIVSRHYNKDERMVPLMERIAWEISERVYKAVDLHTLFKEDRAAAKKKLVDAKSTLEQWRKCYFAVRAQIEASGREEHWEFDRKRLFEKTDYMTSICQDLYDMLQVIEEFYNIIGPELKAVTGDPERVDDIMRAVNGLTSPMEELTFDPFSIENAHDWKLIVEEFKEEVSNHYSVNRGYI
ncbi:hypothetical protein llap_19128 [Limosa lapponica baueri]|uniref:Dynein heavy chain tail domain-containing protein n=1 Tax=Limosa lapponica baueri TaxID=1758121 RepID=A0A2I0T9U8_LIMLA|nr:hypothetical protein llap_19128 [Limosa lapponica baueri]